MAKVDLHVHSSYSERPSEWFLQRLGTRESYIDPEEVYRNAKREGMDFVTITDHNTIEGALRLRDKHPSDVFIGVETTTYFPDNGTKIHILIWGIDEGMFRLVDSARNNIFELRQLLLTEGLTHAVAHPTFAVNGLLTFEQIEQLFLMFDIFETNNGSRERSNTEILTRVFDSFTPDTITALSRKYQIPPLNQDSWYKGRIGGSDDHSGLFIGKTYTIADALTTDEFLARIKQKQTRSQGRNNDYQGLAFAVYKVAYDFSRSKSNFTDSILGAVNSLVFDEKPLDIKKGMILNKLKFTRFSKKNSVGTILSNLVHSLQEHRNSTPDQKLEIICSAINQASDEMIKELFRHFGKSLREGDLISLVKSISGILPGVFLSLPFFTSMNLMNQSKKLHDRLTSTYIPLQDRKKKKILWFTDTLLELSGVCSTLQELAQVSFERNLDLVLVTCLPPTLERADNVKIPPNVIDLPCIYSYTPEFFNTYTLRIPSLLKSMHLISQAAPDEIYISTPGTVGLLGILASKLLHIPSTAVYHTDFTNQFKQIIGDDTMCRTTEEYVNWFYSLADTVASPTKEYSQMLGERGFNTSKVKIFKRGINPRIFAPIGSREYLKKKFGITDGITLLHSGRISKEKNLDFLADVYDEIQKNIPTVNIIFAGDGPYFAEYKKKLKKFKRAFFAGRMSRYELPALYASSQFLLFPSTTDTFGMVVLEAQSCGTPAVVSNIGGPQEIIINGKTGFVAKADSIHDWTSTLVGLIELFNSYPHVYLEMRAASRKHVMENYSWDTMLEDIFHMGTLEYEKMNGIRFKNQPIPFYSDMI
jgi:glycosyltransferase involved in cell wall biosynthesis/predicted metal-dependent phosphoesterase TrpH